VAKRLVRDGFRVVIPLRRQTSPGAGIISRAQGHSGLHGSIEQRNLTGRWRVAT
jgi:hypothetical protein